MRHPERERSNGAEHRDAVVRTVILAFVSAVVSLAAWWGCSSVASAGERTAADPGDAGTAGEAAPESLADLPVFATPAASPAPATALPASPPPSAHATALPASPPTLPMRPTDRGAAGGAGATSATEGTGVEVVVAEPAEVAVADPPAAVAPGQPPVSGPAQEPVLLPTVVVPLVEAVSPALAPVGDAVQPLLDAVTTPAAPLVQTVVPVVDRLAGPAVAPVVTPLVAVVAPVVTPLVAVVAPVVTPLVAVVAPVIEQAATAVAPVAGLAAPLVVPVVRPVVALVAPLLEHVSAAIAAPLVGIVGPALESRGEGSSRSVGFRSSTAAFAADPHAGPGRGGGLHLGSPEEAPAPPAGAHRSAIRDVHPTPAGLGPVAGDGAAILSGARAGPPAADPFDGPFHPAPPAPRAAVMTHAGPDTGQRDQRLVTVLSPAAGLPAARLSALPGAAAVPPPARSGGRPPTTPD